MLKSFQLNLQNTIIDNDLSRGTILVVEDEAVHRFLLLDLLERKGYEVISAESGEKAFAILEKQMPSLILLDVMMPDIDGFEICARLKANQATEKIPVIFITSLDDDDDIIAGFEVGGADYLTKPFKPGEILVRVKTQLQLHKALSTLVHINQNLKEVIAKESKELIKAERAAAFSQLLQGIVHNLRSPLTVIMGGVQLARERVSEVIYELKCSAPNDSSTTDSNMLFPLLDDAANLMDMTKNGALGLGKLVDSLMVKGRQDQKNGAEVFDLNDLVRKELEFLNGDLVFKNKINKEIDLTSAPLLVKAVFSEVAQVFNNLLRNSIDALYGRPKNRSLIKIRTSLSGQHALMTVEDTGGGIKKEHLGKIFDPFFSTKPAPAEKNGQAPSGTGLGLYICQHILAEIGGGLEVTSAFSKGTSVQINIPLAKEEDEH